MNTPASPAAPGRVRGLSSNALKLIAIAAMTVDHLTWAVFPGLDTRWYVILLHIVGRLTAPIMWFFVAEGCHFTRSPRKYALRLFAFAVVSHFAYCFAFGIPMLPLSTGAFNQTSVLWSLALAVCLIFLCRDERVPEWVKYVGIAAACVLSFPSDWSSIAVMAPFFLYRHRGNVRRQAWDIILWTAVYAAVYFIFIDRIYGVLQMFTFLCIPLLAKYNGTRGSWRGMKWFFYIYYPAHLVVIGIVRLILHGDVPIIF